VRFTRPGKAVINARTPHQQPRSGQQPGRRTSPVNALFSAVFNIAGRSPYTPGELALLALAGLAIALAARSGPPSGPPPRGPLPPCGRSDPRGGG
jgi:hypothetical protein